MAAKILLESLLEETHKKQELALRIREQMGPDYEAKKISDYTVSQIKLAIDNFEACIQKLRGEEWDDAVYFFSRGCWNLGEGLGRAKLENPKKQQLRIPEVLS